MIEDEAAFLQMVGMRIRVLRIRFKLTQERTSKRAGMSRAVLGAFERGEAGIDAIRLRRLAHALGGTLPALVAESDEWAPGVHPPAWWEPPDHLTRR